MITYRRRSDIRFRVIDGEAVVLRQNDDEVMVLNALGTRILELADQGGSDEQIVGVLLEEFEVGEGFEVGEEELVSDTREFLDDMIASGVLELAADAADSTDSDAPDSDAEA